MADRNQPGVGHRIWLIWPRFGGYAFGEYDTHHGIYVLTNSTKNNSQPLPKFLAYPGPGYFPGNMVSDRLVEWSFQLWAETQNNGALLNTTVSVVGPEGPVNVLNFNNTRGFITFVPEVTAPSSNSSDRKYTVTISGIKNQYLSTISYDVILFKQNSASIIFDANGGSGTMANQYVGNENSVLATNTFTKANNALAGWATTPTGPIVFQIGDSISSNNSNFSGSPKQLKLYAIWNCSVGGKIVANTNRVNYGESTTLNVLNSFGTIQWQSSLDNVTFSDIPGATSATLNTGTVYTSTYFRTKVTGTCAADYSSAINIKTINESQFVLGLLGNTNLAIGESSTLTINDSKIALDGVDDYIGTNLSLNDLSEFTIEGRVFANSLTGTGTYVGFFGQNGVVQFGTSFGSYFDFKVYKDDGSSIMNSWGWATNNYTFALNTWHHVAIVGQLVSITSREVQVYVDGVLKTKTLSSTPKFGRSNN
jgi:hypothetical protein